MKTHNLYFGRDGDGGVDGVGGDGGLMMVAVGVEVVVVTVMMGGLVMGQYFNNNNNMLYLHDCNKVLQYCKS